MKKLLISFLLFLLLSPLFAGADVVVFKDGKRIETKGTWKENEQIKCYYRGGIVGFPEELIERIEKVEVEKKVEKQRTTTRTSSNNMVDVSSIESEINDRASCQLELVNTLWSEGYGYATYEGQVKNISNSKLKNVQAVVTWYDRNDNMITSSSALIEYNPILPGQSSPFKVMKTYNPAMGKAGVEFSHLMGGTIRTCRKK